MPFHAQLVGLFLVMYCDRAMELSSYKQEQVARILDRADWIETILAKMTQDATDEETIEQVFRLQRRWKSTLTF